MPSKQEALLGRDAGAEGRRVREMERTALPRGSQSQMAFKGMSTVKSPGGCRWKEMGCKGRAVGNPAFQG